MIDVGITISDRGVMNNTIVNGEVFRCNIVLDFIPPLGSWINVYYLLVEQNRPVLNKNREWLKLLGSLQIRQISITGKSSIHCEL